ncbi:MAG: GNAT family N-acetyltransferase [Runella sp.]
MFELETPRLRLIALTFEQLRLHATDYTALQHSLGLTPYEMHLEPPFQAEFDDALVNYWLPETAANTSHYQWFTNWLIVLKSASKVIGGIGVTGLPDEQGETEIGYSIAPDYRGRGIATEAVMYFSEWVFRHPNAHTLIARTPTETLASQRVLTKAGFSKINEENHVILWKKRR